MNYHRLLEHKRFFLAGDIDHDVAGCINDVFLQQGGCASNAVSDCDIFVFIVNPANADQLDEVTKPCCFLTQAALGRMQSRCHGSVIYVNPTEAMRAMGYAIAMDVCKFDIRVNYVSHLQADPSDQTACETVERYADAALYLASDMSKNVTGQTLWTHAANAAAAQPIRIREIQNGQRNTGGTLYVEPQGTLKEKLSQRLDGGMTLTDDPDQCQALVFTGSAVSLQHMNDLSEAEFDRIWQTDYVRAYDRCLKTARRMQSGQGGHIILVTTDNLAGGARLTAAVSAAAGALKGLMQQINRTYDKVRCNIVMAGALASALSQGYEALYTEQYGAESRTILDGMQLIPKRDDDLDVIDAVRFLLSGEASAVSGQCIPVNGGIRTLAHANMIFYFKAR